MDPVIINMAELTLGVIEDAEKVAGRPLLGEIAGSSRMSATTLAALTVVFAARQGRNITLDEARGMKIDGSDFQLETGEPDPTPASS